MPCPSCLPLPDPDAGLEVADRRPPVRRPLRAPAPIVGFILLVICGLLAEARADTRIAFYAERWGLGEICTMNPDGTNLTRLTQDGFDDSSPAISSDGSRIAYLSNRDGNFDLFVMSADGTDVRRLTTTSANEFDPGWSPDDTQIVFTRRTGYASDGDIYTINADGTNCRQVTATAADEMRPDWSPDGSALVFSSTRDGHWEIYVLDADSLRRVTNGPGEKVLAQWSPDGSRIAYAWYDFSLWRANIHVIDLDGTDDIPLTNLPCINEDPVWSPDGTKIAFQSNRAGNYEIYTMDADGANQQRLTFDPHGDFWPTWGLVPVADVDEAPVSGLGLRLVSPMAAGGEIHFDVPREAMTRIELFDNTGRLVRTVLRERLTPGTRTVSWDGRDDGGRPVSAGMYYCRFVSGEASRTAKLVFVK